MFVFSDGMMKLRDVYQKTPALGDATSLDKQLEENAQKLDKLKLDLNKYEVRMEKKWIGHSLNVL